MGPEPRTGGLDGLRGLAALSVVAFHVWLYRPERVSGTRTGLGDHLFFETISRLGTLVDSGEFPRRELNDSTGTR